MELIGITSAIIVRDDNGNTLLRQGEPEELFDLEMTDEDKDLMDGMNIQP